MDLNATRTVSPLRISGSFSFSTEDLLLVFTPDADPDVEDLFYHIFSDSAWMSKKTSEQFGLLQDLARRIEAAKDTQAANLAGTLSEPQQK